MKTDKELLELAAKAVGIQGDWVRDYGSDYYYQGNTDGIMHQLQHGGSVVWNPLTDDGDALRLAVKLKIDITNQLEYAECYSCFYKSSGGIASEKISGCPLAATRRAIVRAAAAIGEKL